MTSDERAGAGLLRTERIDATEQERRDIHARWSAHRNRPDWHPDQCLFCRFYLPLDGPLGLDYGACANRASPFDGRVMFEHDGCEAFEHNDAYDEEG